MPGFDPYQLLNVSREAGAPEIRAAFRQLAKSAHPDAGGAPETWATLQRAYDILMDAEARAHFDATGEAADPKRVAGDGKAMEYISLTLGLALTGDKDLLGTDLVKAIEEALRHKRDETQDFVARAERALARVKRLRKRFARKTDGANDLEGMLDWHETALAEGLESNKARVVHLTRALEIIAQYEFSPEGGGWMLPKMMSASTTTTTM